MLHTVITVGGFYMDVKVSGLYRPLVCISFLSVLMLAFQNCGEVRFEESAAKRAGFSFPKDGCSQDTFSQPHLTFGQKVDLLIVTDTSASLDTERRTVAQEIDQFVNALPQGADYQIAVMLGHLAPPVGGTDWVGRLFQANNEPFVLSSKELSSELIRANLLQKLTNIDLDRYSTGGGESGIFSLTAGLGERFAENRALGFFRPDAALSVVFISDENDICVPEGNASASELQMYNDHCDPTIHNDSVLYRSLINTVGGNSLVLGGVLHRSIDEVSEASDGVGLGYLELVAHNGGIVTPISQTDRISNGLSQIGELMAARLSLITERRLYEYEVNHSIEVRVNGVLAPEGSYTVNPLVPSIRLLDSSATGSANSTVEILNCEPWVEDQEDSDE